MDEKFDNLVKGFLPNQNKYREKIVNLELQIPGLHITADGKDVKEILDSKDFSSFMEQDASKVQVELSLLPNNPDFLDKEKMLTYFDGYSSDVEEYFQYNISVIQQILSSMVDLIPSELNNEGKRIALSCLFFSKEMSNALTRSTNSIRSVLSDNRIDNNLNDLTKLKISRLQKSILVHLFVELNYLVIYTMWCRQHVYDYFYGPEEEKSVKADMIKQITESVVEQISLNFTPQLDRIEKNTTQTVKNTQASIDLNNKIITNQILNSEKNSRELEMIEDKVNKRNRADKRKPLTQEECATILYKQKINYFKKKENYLRHVGMTATKPKLPKDEKTVERTIQRWDQYLSSDGEKGTKPPKGYSRERSRKEFEDWAETLELISYEKWEKEQPIIRRKNKSDGLVATHSPEKEDEENLEEEEDDQETRGQGNLVDRVAHPTKRD